MTYSRPSWQLGLWRKSLDSRTELSPPGVSGRKPGTPWVGSGCRNSTAGASGPT